LGGERTEWRQFTRSLVQWRHLAPPSEVR
jgi:hypothetical protein